MGKIPHLEQGEQKIPHLKQGEQRWRSFSAINGCGKSGAGREQVKKDNQLNIRILKHAIKTRWAKKTVVYYHFAFYICRQKLTQVLEAQQHDDEGEQCEQAGRTPCPAEAPQQSEQVCPLHIDQQNKYTNPGYWWHCSILCLRFQINLDLLETLLERNHFKYCSQIFRLNMDKMCCFCPLHVSPWYLFI